MQYKEIGENLKSIFRHFMDPQELCIVPLNLHLGLVIGFIFGDFTRSFISCIAGVQQVCVKRLKHLVFLLENKKKLLLVF